MDLLTVDDIREIFHCGLSKAYRIAHAVPHVRIGRSLLVRRQALEAFLTENDSVPINW